MYLFQVFKTGPFLILKSFPFCELHEISTLTSKPTRSKPAAPPKKAPLKTGETYRLMLEKLPSGTNKQLGRSPNFSLGRPR
jgi:hypothetical protein